jgi:hypothetical protein
LQYDLFLKKFSETKNNLEKKTKLLNFVESMALFPSLAR